jgi:hypothetical protein
LHERGIAAYELDEVLVEGRTITELLEDCVQRADLVIAVVSGGADNVSFEVGYAMALRKRMLALVPPGEELPIWLSTTPHLRVNPDNREAIEFGLNTLLSVPKGDRPTSDASRQSTPIGPLADDLLGRLTAASNLPSDDELIRIVGDAFRTAGASPIAYGHTQTDAGVSGAERRQVADIAVWSDEFEPWLGNPLLVEVRRLSNAKEMVAALEQTTALLESRKLSWGLFLYVGAPVPAAMATKYPGVFAVAIERFLESLRDTRLGTWLGQMRNARVHGRG